MFGGGLTSKRFMYCRKCNVKKYLRPLGEVMSKSAKRGRFQQDLVGAAITIRGRIGGRIEKSRDRDGKKMANGLPLGQISIWGQELGCPGSQHPDLGQDFVCPENLVEIPAMFCRLGHFGIQNIQMSFRHF